ncbi:MAG: GcrA family cell cycle regulator [Pseudomonadota bacterium]
MSWTDERVEKLRELWGEGKSASQIAKELGGVTRNAVIGKVHRLGLSNRAASPAEEAKPAEPVKAKAAAPKKPVQEAPAVVEAAPVPAPVTPQRRVAPQIRDASQPRAPGAPTPEEEAARATLVEIQKFAKRISLLELTERTCKWPIGDPTDDDFAFCGLQAVPGKPYCENHVAVAFQPMSSRRDRARVRN